MAINVALQNSQTNEVKFIKVGFSWSLFFFSTFLGIPLFIRRLYWWGLAMLALNLAAVAFPIMMPRGTGFIAQLAIGLVQLFLMFYLGIKGNELTAKNWLSQSWRFTEPQSDMVRYAKLRWHIFEPQAPVANTTTPTSVTP